MHQKQNIFISGMSCVSCETNITGELKKIPGLSNINVSRKNNSAEVHFEGEKFPFAEIKQRVEALGYRVSGQPFKAEQKTKATAEQWFYSILLVLGIYLVYKYLQWIGLLNWLNFNPASVNLGAAFLIGLVASVSTCLVVVGAVVMSFASKYQAHGTYFQRNLKPHLLFHLGRITSFFVLGGILGLIGSVFNVSSSLTGWFTIFIAVVLLWLALNILGFLPSISTLGLRMPKKTLHLWEKLKDSEHALAPVLLGAFTFFLPCGFTQSMQLLAMASGSFWIGALTMSIFAVGTMPVLFGLGLAASRFQNKKSVVMQKAVGLIVLVFAFYTAIAGLAVTGISVNLGKAKDIGLAVNTADAQVIKMAVDYAGYTPSTFKLKKDVPVRWVIDGQAVSGCTRDIIVPSLGIRKQLKSGENIIEFTPTKAGNVAFSCGMGMVRGNFIVE